MPHEVYVRVRRGAREDRLELRAAAVVHNDDGDGFATPQLGNERRQGFARTIGWDENRVHFLLVYKFFPGPPPPVCAES